MSKVNIFIIHANHYDFTDPKTGRVNKGTTIQYCMTDTLNPAMDERGALGYRPAKGSLSALCDFGIKAVPGFYEADIDLSVGYDGQPKTVFKGVEFLCDCAVKVPDDIKSK